jgi:hypothetical protein
MVIIVGLSRVGLRKSWATAGLREVLVNASSE